MSSIEFVTHNALEGTQCPLTKSHCLAEPTVISAKQNYGPLCAGPLCLKNANIEVERGRRVGAIAVVGNAQASRQSTRRVFLLATKAMLYPIIVLRFHIHPIERRRLRVMATLSNTPIDRERVRIDGIPDDAMQYTFPFCLAEGSTPMSVKHHVDCPHLKRAR